MNELFTRNFDSSEEDEDYIPDASNYYISFEFFFIFYFNRRTK